MFRTIPTTAHHAAKPAQLSKGSKKGLRLITELDIRQTGGKQYRPFTLNHRRNGHPEGNEFLPENAPKDRRTAAVCHRSSAEGDGARPKRVWMVEEKKES